nr:MAG TPA: hypothetical protein [Caudoviricetes sp.]
MIIYLVNDCCFVLIFKDSSGIYRYDSPLLIYLE